jgi:hypothetical protein
VEIYQLTGSAVILSSKTHSFTGGDLQNLCGETDRSLDTKLLVLGAVDQIAGDYNAINDSDRC